MAKSFDYSFTIDTTKSPDGTPAPPSTFNLNGGNDNEINTGENLYTQTTTEIPDTGVKYYYKAKLTTVKDEPPYDLDDTEFEITVTIDPTQTVEADKVKIEYSPTPEGTHTAPAGWTHSKNDPTVYGIPFKFYQKLNDHSSDGSMNVTQYSYSLLVDTEKSSTGTPPTPKKTSFTLDGGKNSEVNTADTLNTNTSE